MSDLSEASPSGSPRLWAVLLCTAAAGGMGWGIRGQYGHETGAMIAGLLVGLAVACLFATRLAGSLSAARVAAFCAIGISFGGSMTYGQTVGLTHDAELTGNWAALRWGLLGLFVKGGIWIGLAGAFLGIGLSGRRHRPLDIALLMFALILLLFAGVWLLNEPFDPAEGELPRIYFSDHWYWEPDKPDLEPRRERWGGLLLALLGVLAYLQVKRDAVARNLALIGFVAGGIGFSVGQCVQAAHAWNPEMIDGWLGPVAPHVNWWNMMETTFGLILGAGLGLGVWLHRHRLTPLDDVVDQSGATDSQEIPPMAEAVLLSLHVAALATWNFYAYRPFDYFADLAITMGLIPAVCTLGGRCSAYFIALPIVALPIAGKTLRQLSYNLEPPFMEASLGWVLLFGLPLVATVAAAWWFAARRRVHSAHSFARWALLLAAWVYFALNFTFFELPWPWAPATGRTPNAVIFFVCAIVLTGLALVPRHRGNGGHAAERPGQGQNDPGR